MTAKRTPKTTFYRPKGPVAVHASALGAEYFAPGLRAPAIHGSVAVISVRGPLEHYRTKAFDSYDMIEAQYAVVCENPTIRTIVLDLDTPGGAVNGCFECARMLRAMAEKANKRAVTFAQNALSAGYALATSGDTIFAARSSIVGSIGIIEQVTDSTAAMAAAGCVTQLVTSGARKADGNPANPLTPETVAAYQTNVDALAAEFFDLVVEQRQHRLADISRESIASLQAAVYTSQAALDLGLVDGIIPLYRLIEELNANPDFTGEYEEMLRRNYSPAAVSAAAPRAESTEPAEKPAPDAKAEGEESEEEAPTSKKPAEPEAEEQQQPDMAKIMKALALLAQAEGDDAAKARKMLAASDDKEEPAAAAPASAAAVAKLVFAQIAERDARAALAARYPGLPEAVSKVMGQLPLIEAEKLAASIKPAPVQPGAIAAARAGLNGAAQPTAGANVGTVAGITNVSAISSQMDRAMGLASAAPVVEHHGFTSVFRAPVK